MLPAFLPAVLGKHHLGFRISATIPPPKAQLKYRTLTLINTDKKSHHICMLAICVKFLGQPASRVLDEGINKRVCISANKGFPSLLIRPGALSADVSWSWVFRPSIQAI
eukprot:scaffold185631_cov32-Prasinocladus_malaysianus.AAC.1